MERKPFLPSFVGATRRTSTLETTLQIQTDILDISAVDSFSHDFIYYDGRESSSIFPESVKTAARLPPSALISPLSPTFTVQQPLCSPSRADSRL